MNPAYSPEGRLFPRTWRVAVQTTAQDAVDVSGLDIEFRILRTLRPAPNRAAVTVWNLSPEHRAQLLARNKPDGPNGRKEPIFVRVEAGYNGNNPVLLYADMRDVASRREGDSWRTLITMDDGGDAVRTARWPDGGKQFTKGSPLSQVLRQTCQALGVGLGNAADYEATAAVYGWGTALPHTMTLTGSAFDSLKRVTDSIGITFSIQGGVLQLLAKGKSIDFNPNKPQEKEVDALVLSPSSGLLDSPEAAINSSVNLGFARIARGGKTQRSGNAPTVNTGIIKAKAMLIPGLVPGRIVRLESDVVTGNYVISECEYVGQSFGPDWMCVMVLRSYDA